MFFITLKKLFLFSKYSNFCNFPPFLSTFSRFKRTNGSGISGIGLHKSAGVIFGIIQEPLYITPSNLVR